MPFDIFAVEGTFQDTSFPSLNLEAWDVSSVMNMEKTFYDFTGDLQVSSWNTGKVTTFRSTFESFRFYSSVLGMYTIPVLSDWDTSNAVTMEAMFKYVYDFGNETDFSQWQVGKVQSFKEMFYYGLDLGSKLSQDLSSWDVCKYYFSAMVRSCTHILVDSSSHYVSYFQPIQKIFKKCSTSAENSLRISLNGKQARQRICKACLMALINSIRI